MRVLLITCGVLLIGTGVWCVGNPGASFLSMAFVIGLVMIFNSLVQLISYFAGRKSVSGTSSSWVAAEAVVTLVLGILILANQMSAEIAIPLVFGLWVIFSGSLRIIAATHINIKKNMGRFAMTFLLGILLVLSGIYCFVNPIFAALSVIMLVGALFFIQGLAAIELGINMPHDKRKRDEDELDK